MFTNNRCSERKYRNSLFNNNVAEFPFDDHQAPSFSTIFDLCKDMVLFFN